MAKIQAMEEGRAPAFLLPGHLVTMGCSLWAFYYPTLPLLFFLNFKSTFSLSSNSVDMLTVS